MAKKNEIIEQEEQGAVTYTPSVPHFQNNNVSFDNVNQGVVAVESSRAVAEAQGKLIVAKRFPRDETVAYEKAMTACRRKGMAETAFYSYPKGGSTVSGASIRFAEELARCWGNIEYGIKELSRDKDKSEMQAMAWDMETNTVSVQNFTNPHYREKNGRMEKLSSDRDIYEINANMGARRLRARILAVLPAYFVEDCINECKKTLAGQNDVPLVDRVRKMVVQFGKYGVSAEMLERRLGRKLETITPEEFVEFTGIFNSLKDKQSTVADWFDVTTRKTAEVTDFLNENIKKGEDKNV